jgi:hypothetical protein
MEMEHCLICFTESDTFINCSNNECQGITCYECAKMLIDFSYKNKEDCKCPNVSCRSEYFFSEIMKLDITSQNNFTRCTTMSLLGGFKNEIDNNITQKQMIDKIRLQRREFVKEFPQAITLFIDYTLQSKLKKITKANKNIIDQMLINKIVKNCFNLFCVGKLDENNKCLICEKMFCNDCEKGLKKDGQHQCNPDDVATVKFVESLVKCPKCFLPVTRSFGCNFITCSVCKTNFDFVTGKKTKVGNHNTTTLVLKKLSNQKPSILYAKFYDFEIIDKIKKFESLEPKDYVFQNVLNLLTKTSNPYESVRITRLICKSYEIYKLNQVLRKRYYQFINYIRESHERNSLNINLVESLIVKYTMTATHQ